MKLNAPDRKSAMRAHWLGLLLAGVSLAFGLSSKAFADNERITRFASDITIHRDGTLLVRETIDVISKNHQIAHGIWREIPVPGIDITGVSRDGQKEPYSIDAAIGGRRVTIGDPKQIIAQGPHTYVITYETGPLIDFHPGFDELYWNVTGNDWSLDIDRAEAVVHLPAGAKAKQSDFYTGPKNSKVRNAQVKVAGQGALQFATTDHLWAHEGLTIAVGFNKGVVAPPNHLATFLRGFALLVRDDQRGDIALLSLLAIIAINSAAWIAYGRDPPRGTVVPLYRPPDDLSPAAIRMLRQMDYDNRTFIAALISLAAKGYARITEEGGVFSLQATGKSFDAAGLDAGERAVAAFTLDSNGDFALSAKNRRALRRAGTALSKTLTSAFEPRYFVVNRIWTWIGIAIMAAGALVSAGLTNDEWARSFLLPFAIGFLVVCFKEPLDAWRKASFKSNGFFFKLESTLHASAIPATIFVLMLIAIWQLIGSDVFLSNVVFGLAYLIIVVFHGLLKRPTLEGARVRDEIEGFRMFLGTAEAPRLKLMDAPQVTPALFEKYLPYAIALDVETAWSKRFEADAADVARPERGNYHPSWYDPSVSRDMVGLSALSFVAALGSGLSGALTSAGSSGGGLSGGGHGGGGGGGW